MTKFFILLIFFLVSSFSASAQCSDLIISELVLGSFNSTLDGNSSISNDYSVEIFNPTDKSILLSDYALILHQSETQDADPDSLIIGLTNSLILEIPSGETYVLSNPDASEAILTKSDDTAEGLDFAQTTTVALATKAGPIDAVGTKYLEEDVSNATVLDILNDPEAAGEFGIDVKGILGFQIRRSALVEEGVLGQKVAELLATWKLDIAVDTADLGSHYGSCLMAIASYSNVFQFTPEERRQEGSFILGETQILFSEGIATPTNISLFETSWELMSESVDGLAMSGFDYSEGFSDVIQTMPAMQTELDVIIFDRTFNDADNNEGTEAVGYELGISIMFPDVRVDPVNDLYDFVIFENPISSTEDFVKNNDILVSPTISPAGGTITLTKVNEGLSLERFDLYSSNGAKVQSGVFDQTNLNHTFDLAPSIQGGIYILYIHTENGYGTRRIAIH